jgi:pyruvate kinase
MKLSKHKTKIVCTIGPASQSREMLERLIHHGMNIARLNFAHGTLDEHRKVIARIRAAAQKTGHRIALLGDLPGPKMRIGQLSADPVTLKKGATIILTTDPIPGDEQQITVNFPDLPQTVKKGDLVFLNDGFIQLKVEKTTSKEIQCRVLVGGPLHSHKGLSLPGIDLGISAITEDDRRLLAFALEEGLDAVSISFVQGPEDIETARHIAGEQGHQPFIIAKIERSQAVRQIDAIVEVADGIMVARGDLGVETPIEEIAMLQKRLIHKTTLRGKPVITATQMLESMTTNSRPTRAEVTDVANAILDGTDCVMLSEESAIGSYPVEATAMLARIAEVTETKRSASPVHHGLMQASSEGSNTVEEVIALNVFTAVERLQPDWIITPTQSGNTARRVSRFKPHPWIIAFSPEMATCQRLLFSSGVYPVHTGKDSRDWETIIREWFQRYDLNKGLAVMTQEPSADHPNINHRLEIIDLAKSKSD